MAKAQGVSGIGVGVLAAGTVLIWAGLKGSSVASILQDLIRGQKPTGDGSKAVNTAVVSAGSAVATTAAGVAGSASASRILALAAARNGQCYGYGAGHSGDPCASKCTDCSSYVSCVLSQATGTRINMATGGLSGIGKGVAYKDRQPGDIIVWNGGTGGGHCGIIATVSESGGTMWHNPCTGCGGVKLGNYPYTGRTAAAAVVRRL